MKAILRQLVVLVMALAAAAPAAYSQMIKIDAPAALAGIPNFGYEHQLTPNLSASGDLHWLPYKWGDHDEVFRSLQLGGELRYYFEPADGYRLASGWYLGAYALYGDFNIGLYRHDDMDRSFRRQGWGVSSGVSGGWKYRFNERWQMDINLGVGYAHLQYHKYKLGNEYANQRIGTWRTRSWIGPTRFSISFGLIIDCGCKH